MNPILRLLADLELVSEGKTRNPDSSGGGKPESRAPVGEVSLHDHFRGRLKGCRSPEALAAWYAEAQEALSVARGGEGREAAPGLRVEKGSLQWKRNIASDITSGVEMSMTLRLFDCSRATYFRVKRDFCD